MARLFSPGATASRAVPLLPTPAEDSIAVWPLLKLTPTQLAQIKNGQNGWLLTESLGALDSSTIIEVNTPLGQAAPPSAGPRTAGPQTGQGQATMTAPTVNLGQVAQPAPTGALNQPTGQLAGVGVKARQQAPVATQAIRVSGPMVGGGAANVKTPQAPAGNGMRMAGMRAPTPAGQAYGVTPAMQLQRARPVAQWALAFGVIAGVAAFAPLAFHLLVIASAIIALVAVSLGATALRQLQRRAPERRLAGIAVTLGVIGLIGSVALTIVSIQLLHR